MIMSPMRIGTERHPDRQDVLEQHVAAQVADLHQRKIIPMVGRRAPLLAVIFGCRSRNGSKDDKGNGRTGWPG
jgi:hypothetical protein